MFHTWRKQPLRDAAPVVVKTPEQLAQEEAARKAYWDECNPLRKFRVSFHDGHEHVVTAHFTTYGDSMADPERVMFFRKRYGFYSVFRPDRELREVVFWASVRSVRFVEMLEE